MFSFLKKKKGHVEDTAPATAPEVEIVQEASPEEVPFKCPTCPRTDTKKLGVTPEGITVCEACGYKKVDKNGIERVYLRLDTPLVPNHKEDRE